MTAMNKSRRCHQCNVNWPNSHAGWVLCQVCGGATEPQPDDSDFETTSMAWAYVIAEKKRLLNHRQFEIYYTEKLKKITEREIKQINKAGSKEWADQFAKLEKLPTKEVSDGQ